MSASPSSDWNPEQYGRFRDERARPFFDLLDLVQPQRGMRVIDIGCGTGELTRELHRRGPRSDHERRSTDTAACTG